MSGESFFKPEAREDPRSARIPGGCDDCAAYQTLDEVEPGFLRLGVHHDDTCPTYRAILARRAGRAS